jgi:gamma-glutamylcyclotransferase (GGCT)/AIG2-like uncharacterized protein YtfP
MTDSAHGDLLAVYGTLRQRSIFQKLPVAVSRLHVVGRGLIRGRLFWQRTFPALIEDRGIARVELVRIGEPKVWPDLDSYEGFDPTNLRCSLFIRKKVLLLNPRLIAWTYFLNSGIPLGSLLLDASISIESRQRSITKSLVKTNGLDDRPIA